METTITKSFSRAEELNALMNSIFIRTIPDNNKIDHSFILVEIKKDQTILTSEPNGAWIAESVPFETVGFWKTKLSYCEKQCKSFRSNSSILKGKWEKTS